MSEELIAGPPPIWTNEYGHLVGYGTGYWEAPNGYQRIPNVFAADEIYQGTRFIGKWRMYNEPTEDIPSSIYLTDYKYAPDFPPWGWMLRGVTTTVWDAIDTGDWSGDVKSMGKRGEPRQNTYIYGYGLIADDGELLHLGNSIHATTEYQTISHIVLMLAPYDPIKELYYFISMAGGPRYTHSYQRIKEMKRGRWYGD